jgi:subtilisin family serine protease
VGLCQSAALVLAVDWAIAQRARIINLSLTGPRDPLLLRVLRQAMAGQIVVVAAAGNRGPEAPPLYPAAEPGVIAVGAVDALGQAYARGASGPHIAVAAPGVEVMSTWPGGEFRTATGTSFAAAQVSGLIALLLELRPALDVAAVRRAIDAALAQAQPGTDAARGPGLIDACRLLGEPC